MSHSLNKIWVHVVFRTKYSEPFITEQIENKIYNFLRKQLIEMDCYVNNINGMPNHIHMLFLLNQKKSMSEVMQQLKGSSSFWINKQELTKRKFEWQTGYASFSVSEFHIETISNYIKNKKEHHGQKKYQKEEEELLYLNSLINP